MLDGYIPLNGVDNDLTTGALQISQAYTLLSF